MNLLKLIDERFQGAVGFLKVSQLRLSGLVMHWVAAGAFAALYGCAQSALANQQAEQFAQQLRGQGVVQQQLGLVGKGPQCVDEFAPEFSSTLPSLSALSQPQCGERAKQADHDVADPLPQEFVAHAQNTFLCSMSDVTEWFLCGLAGSVSALLILIAVERRDRLYGSKPQKKETP